MRSLLLCLLVCTTSESKRSCKQEPSFEPWESVGLFFCIPGGIHLSVSMVATEAS